MMAAVGFDVPGQGEVKCFKCKGSGELRNGKTCDKCDGRGRIECQRCGGTGWLDD